MLYARGTFSGNPEVQGNLQEARMVVVHEFSTPEIGRGAAHVALAHMIVDNEMLRTLPIISNAYTAAELADIAPELEDVKVFSGVSTSFIGVGAGTRGEITQTKQYMLERFGMVVPSVHLGHNQHVGRVAQQARAQQLSPIIIAGNPGGFQKNPQGHTSGPIRFALHELFGVPWLHISRKF